VASNTGEAVSDRAREMADSEPVQYVRANPIPTAMIGIGIAGLTWLALGGRESQPRNRYRGRSSRDWRRLAPYDEGERYYRGGTGHTGYSGQGNYTGESGFGDAGFGEAGYPGQGGYETAAAYNPDLDINSGGGGSYSSTRRTFGNEYRGNRGDYADRSSSWTGGMADSVSDTAQDLSRRAQQTTSSAQRKLQRSWQQNPLMMGAASAVLGLIVGMAVPQTEIENEYMGEARDNALEGVQQTVRETVGKVQDAATSAVGLVTGDQKSGNQGAPGNQGNQWNQAQRQQPPQSTGSGTSATTPGTTANNPSQQGRQNQPGTPKQPGNQPPKNPGDV